MKTIYSSPRPTNSARIAFWLVPAAPDRLRLGKIINRLAHKYNGPRFLPHITLWSTQLAKDESPLQILEAAAERFAPFSLEPTGLGHGPHRFKSVFIQFSSAPISVLSKALGSSCRTPAKYCFDAHLSLFYGQLRTSERKKIISELQLPQSLFHFDTVFATIPGPGQTSFDKVNQWQHVAQLRMQAP